MQTKVYKITQKTRGAEPKGATKGARVCDRGDECCVVLNLCSFYLVFGENNDLILHGVALNTRKR